MKNRVPDKGYCLSSSVVPDVYGWVEVNGEPLNVYGATETENKSIGYVEAKEGQQFVVCLSDQRKTPPGTDYITRVWLDGTQVNGRIWPRDSGIFGEALGCEFRYVRLTGRQTSRTSEQPFLFSKLRTTDSDELACEDEQVVKNLGTIQLRYQRVKNVRQATAPSTYDAVEPKVFHEKAKKAQLSHQAAYGESVQIPKMKRSAFDLIDEEASPLFQFEFRYRSRQLLQLEGHIPSSPSPSPGPEAEQSQSPDSPVASTSNTNRSVSATQPSPAPQTEDAQERLARLKERFESLRRQEEMARLQREIAALEGEVGASPSSSSSRKIKAEPPEDQRELKRVKQEIGETSLSQSGGLGKGKGKEKKKADVIVLSDSD
ncbi:hypothetical protein JCM3765_001620 [Sporobolomyces pararoseus]